MMHLSCTINYGHIVESYKSIGPIKPLANDLRLRVIMLHQNVTRTQLMQVQYLNIFDIYGSRQN